MNNLKQSNSQKYQNGEFNRSSPRYKIELHAKITTERHKDAKFKIQPAKNEAKSDEIGGKGWIFTSESRKMKDSDGSDSSNRIRNPTKVEGNWRMRN